VGATVLLNFQKAGAIPVGAGLPANTGAAGAMHRVGFFAAKAAPTGYADCPQVQRRFQSTQPQPTGQTTKVGAVQAEFPGRRCPIIFVSLQAGLYHLALVVVDGFAQAPLG